LVPFAALPTGPLVAALVVVAALTGLLLVRLPSLQQLALFPAVVTGLLVWFLVRSIPDQVATLTAGVLRLVAPYFSGPLEVKQLELGLAIMGAQFVGAVLVLLAYAFGMRHGRAPFAEQSTRVGRIRVGMALAASFCAAAWAPQFLPGPLARNGVAIFLLMSSVGAAIGVLVQRNGLEGLWRLRLGAVGLALAGATMALLPAPRALLALASGASVVALVYLVGQLVEQTSLEIRRAGRGGMLPATVLGFVVGVALGR
jgi:hypothetical protein